jgi:hypothetical protein
VPAVKLGGDRLDAAAAAATAAFDAASAAAGEASVDVLGAIKVSYLQPSEI